MLEVIVLFHTHFGAIDFERQYRETLSNFALKPTPRKLSSGCGICAAFQLDRLDAVDDFDDTHIAAVYEVSGTDYRQYR